jgi:hypothetical protein
MKSITIIPVAAMFAIARCTCAFADQTPPAATLLYLDQQGWEQASSEAKVTLAADFMRLFCGNPAMPAADLVGCLDRTGNIGSLFARAMACVATVPTGR